MRFAIASLLVGALAGGGCGDRDATAHAEQVHSDSPRHAPAARAVVHDPAHDPHAAADLDLVESAAAETGEPRDPVDALHDGAAVAGATTHPLLERMVLIGASLTQGFGATLPIANPDRPDGPPEFVPIALGDAVAASMRNDSGPAVAQGDLFFFMRPDRAGERLAAMALDREPSVLVAIDFLFWFGYGQLASGETRLSRLERGLALLDRFTCPIVIADFPDLSEAVGRMISAAQMPSDVDLARLNRRVREWAESRGEVAVLPLAEMIEQLRNGTPITIAGARWENEATDDLLQEDRMHATPAGMLVVVRRLFTELATLEPAIGEVRAMLREPEDAMRSLHDRARARLRSTPTP